MSGNFLYDGQKAVAIEALPPEAWQPISGKPISKDKIFELYEGVAFLFACVDKRANAVASVPWTISKGDTVVWESDSEEPPDELACLADSGTGSFHELLHRTEAMLSLLSPSRAYWYKNANTYGIVKEVRWFDPESVIPQWDEKAGLLGFERTLGTRKIPLAVEDVVYFWRKGKHETEPASAPAKAAMLNAGLLYSSTLFASYYFDRGAIKATILTVPPTTPKEEKDKLKAWWDRITGVTAAWKAHVFSSDLKPVVIGEGMSELSDKELTVTQREGIATAMGVPYSVVMSNAANHATAETDKLTFYDMTILPECQLIARPMNRQLFGPLGYTFRWHPDKMQIYQVDETVRSQSFANYVSSGVRRSVAGEMLGLDLPQGVQYADLDKEPVFINDGVEEGDRGSRRGADIMGYHIEQGIVTLNEARADVGLPPVDDSNVVRLRDLRAQLEVMIAAKNAGISLEQAAELVELPIKVEAPEPVVPPAADGDEPAPAPEEEMPVDDKKPPAKKSEDRLNEERRFRNWAKKRIGKRGVTPGDFDSEILDAADKANLWKELREGGAAVDATFHSEPTGWHNYP